MNQNSIAINAGGLLALHGPSQTASVTNNLSITGNGTLDLGGNGIVVNYTGASPLPALQAAIATGANGGTYAGPYTGPAITSSAAAANSALAIGYGEASTIMPSGGTFLGATVPAGANAVLARTTYGGDASLDGTVNFSDFLVLQRNYNQPGNWSQGDFNGDGVVNFSDFLVLQRNYNQTYSASPSVQVAGSGYNAFSGSSRPALLRNAPSVALTRTNSPSITVTVKAASATASASGSTPGSSGGGSASPNALAPTVTYILSINDNGSGVTTPGSYAIYAVDSTSDGNGGIASYEVNVSGATTISSASKNGAPYGYYDDGTGSGNDVQIGFSALRRSTTAGGVNTPNLTGAQDTVGANGLPYVAVYGVGQSSGNLASLAPANSTGLDTTMGHTTSQTYSSQLLLATGTYSGAAPAFVLNTNGTQNSDGANLWVNRSTASLEAGAIDLVTQTLPAPEPSSLALTTIAAAGLLLTRRRRICVATTTSIPIL